MTLLAGLLSGVVVALLVPGGRASPGSPASRRRDVRPIVVALAVGVLVTVLGAWLSVRQFALVVVLLGLVAGTARLVQRQRATRAAERRTEQVLAVCEALASDLAAGQPPLVSLDRVAVQWPDLAPAAVAGRMGADVPDLLRELAKRPGAGHLATLAATWQVAHDTGSGLAVAIAQAASAIRTDRRTTRLVAAELASARATAQLLAVLPVGVLLLGSGLGGDPLGFLTGSLAGIGCLALGLLLSFAGMLWLERIADRVLGR